MPDPKAQTHNPVVAIGASAGGLEACRTLLEGMPDDTPAALILILHLDPSHDSFMVDLLTDHTTLTVVQAKNGAALRPGHLYVIPPGVFMTVAKGIIHLAKPKVGNPVRLPFDVLLQSLAKDVAERAVCVVLSGTGTDGTKGLSDISAAGGIVIAQDPAETGYSGMPDSAIATGLVSHILPAGQIGAALSEIWSAASSAADPGKEMDVIATPGGAEPKADFDEILAYLGEFSAHDLAHYKRGTLERRITRRMALHNLAQGDVARYLALIRRDAVERKQLGVDLLIHVTGFFRDRQVFDHLSATALPDLIAKLPTDRPFRVWAAGCSTGEEAYSLAIVCLEALEAVGSGVRLQILASDIDPDAIAAARAGFYSEAVMADVSPAHRARYFVAEEGGWRVLSTLRDVIVFTVADLLSDPPFSKIDLVSCRNVLIYLGPDAQKLVVARCCFALRQGGLLLLGAAEMPGPGDGCFAVEDKEARLWRRVGNSHPDDLQFNLGGRPPVPSAPHTPVQRNSLADLCRRIVLEHYAPAAVLVNSRFDCLYLLGPTENYLKVTQGHPDPGLLGMLPKALRVRLKAAAATCTPTNPRVTISGGRVEGSVAYDIALHAVSSGNQTLILVCFINTPRPVLVADKVETSAPNTRTKDLEAELEATRRDLMDALRDLEHEVEAHSADAAEALSVNEEFQSTNEELLASKEELQSLNEELTALNGQLQETLEQHHTTANDLKNVLYSTDIATLFLDLDLNIRFFTPAVRAIFNVIATDVGRPLADLSSVAKDDSLTADARKVLKTRKPVESETAGTGDKWFLRSIQPYRAEGDRIEGVVITYEDITETRKINTALVAARDEADRATKAKSRFLASASHDLRQPLQSMALLHKLMLRHRPTTEGARLSVLLDQTLHSMTTMLDSMLDVNRIDSGIVHPVMKPVPIAPLMQRLTDEFTPHCGLKKLKLRSVLCKAWVQTDPALLEQILRNLLSNALKYTPEGGILMGCRRRGATLTIVVCDSGIGVSEAESKVIFDAYYQVEKGPALSGQGLGLGLSIVQRLAELMEYPIAVRSTKGKGSAFMITLPVVAPGAEVVPDTTAQTPKEAGRQTGTILLVEDEEPLRHLLEEVLVKEGHRVIARGDAQGAMDWASGDVDRPDLLLTDFDLHGGTTGLRLAQDMPDVLGAPLPTIILTGDITTETMKSITDAAYIQVAKPVLPVILLAEISELLQVTRASNARARLKQSARISVHVIDDDPMIRAITRRLFEAEGWIVTSHASAEDFLAHPRPGDNDCLLIDNLLPGMDGIALVTKLRAENVHVPAIMLTGHGDASVAVAAMKAGAADLIEKPASAAELLAAVRRAIEAGGDTAPRSEAHKEAKKRFADLTPREREVLKHVLTGAPNKNIAADLGINQRTVENHRASVMRKTGAGSLPALVRLALAANTPAT